MVNRTAVAAISRDDNSSAGVGDEECAALSTGNATSGSSVEVGVCERERDFIND